MGVGCLGDRYVTIRNVFFSHAFIDAPVFFIYVELQRESLRTWCAGKQFYKIPNPEKTSPRTNVRGHALSDVRNSTGRCLVYGYAYKQKCVYCNASRVHQYMSSWHHCTY